MRCNPLRWLWGLLPLGILIWVAVVNEEQPIERDLHLRTQSALSQAGFNWAGTGFDGRDGLVKGVAFREEHPGQAARIVKGVWGVRVVEAKVDLIDLVENYTWSAQSDDGKITLEGHVPNDDVRAQILSKVKKRFPKSQIVDRLKHARGAPDAAIWLTGIDFGLKRLTQLKAGSVELSGLDLSIAGEARDFANYKSAKAALAGAMPDGIKLANDKIRPPVISPYTWKAERSSSQLVLSGHVPSEEARERLFAIAKKTYPTLVIIDRMETGAGAPARWETSVKDALAQVARLETGTLDLKDTVLALVGEAPDADTANAVIAELKQALPEVYEFSPSLTFPDPKPPVVSPFTTSIEATPENVRLTGYVPDEDTRTRFLKATRKAFPGTAVIDDLALGSGQPEGWDRCVMAGLEAIRKLGSGVVDMSDKLLQVSGTTSDEALAEALKGEVRAATTRACEAQVEIDLDLPSEPNLTWRANYDGERTLVLDGQVPDIETLTLILKTARAKFPDADLENRMSIASGYSAKWQKVATTGINLLSLLRSGEASISGQDLIVRGIAGDTAAQTAVKDRLSHTLEKNYTGRSLVEVKSDAMIWAEQEAKRKAKEEKQRRIAAEEEAVRQKEAEATAARLKAEAEDEARRAAEAEAEAEERRKAEAEERRKAEAEAEERRRAEAEAEERRRAEAEAEERRRAEAEAEERRRAEAEAEERRKAEAEARRKAEAEAEERRRAEAEAEERRRAEAEAEERRRAEAEAEERRKAEAAAEERRRAEEEIEVRLKSETEKVAKAAAPREFSTMTPEQKREAIDCQQRMRNVANAGVILFEYAKADLSAESFTTLDRLAQVAKSCPQVGLDVEGHTDSVGGRTANRSLSLRRANAVIDYLVSAGVPRPRLRPVGYGEDKPVAPNNSSSNRAKNRRIEFSVSRSG